MAKQYNISNFCSTCSSNEERKWRNFTCHIV